MKKHYISQDNWQRIYPTLSKISGIQIASEDITKLFVKDVHFILKTASQWHELSPYYGKWRSVHKRYEAWYGKNV